MTESILEQIRECVQVDAGQRGLATDPQHNLFNHCPEDYIAAAVSIANNPGPRVAILTGFWIPHANPPAPETDGPLGAIFLAKVLTTIGIPVALLTDTFARPSMEIGVQAAGLENQVTLMTLPMEAEHWNDFIPNGWLPFALDRFQLTHLIASERPGPSHTLESLQAQAIGQELGETQQTFVHEVPQKHQDRYHAMRGTDITEFHSPAHLLFESLEEHKDRVTTIGIGDGGNELGMGKIPWEVIRRNVHGGGKTACRIATDYLLVAGLSNWGVYALVSSVLHLRAKTVPPEFYSPQHEEDILTKMVQGGPQVDGVLAYPNISVDGLSFPEYAEPLERMANLIGISN